MTDNLQLHELVSRVPLAGCERLGASHRRQYVGAPRRRLVLAERIR